MEKLIYTPRSGSRLFCLAEAYMEGLGWELETLPNSSFYFRGECAVWYSIYTANPGSHWRREAKYLLQTLAAFYPIIGWDACGEVNVITSPVGAIRQITLLREIEPEAHNADWRKVTAQLLSSGCYFIAASQCEGVEAQIVLPLSPDGSQVVVATIPEE